MEPKTERNLAIYREYLEGKTTYQKLGEKHGICKERIRQIIRRQQFLENRAELRKRS